MMCGGSFCVRRILRSQLFSGSGISDASAFRIPLVGRGARSTSPKGEALGRKRCSLQQAEVCNHFRFTPLKCGSAPQSAKRKIKRIFLNAEHGGGHFKSFCLPQKAVCGETEGLFRSSTLQFVQL